MGIDLLDLSFRVERALKIKLYVPAIIERASTICPETKRRDLQVRNFVQIVKRAIEDQNASYEDHFFKVLQPHIAECLCVKESEVTPDAWMIHDLGME